MWVCFSRLSALKTVCCEEVKSCPENVIDTQEEGLSRRNSNRIKRWKQKCDLTFTKWLNKPSTDNSSEFARASRRSSQESKMPLDFQPSSSGIQWGPNFEARHTFHHRFSHGTSYMSSYVSILSWPNAGPTPHTYDISNFPLVTWHIRASDSCGQREVAKIPISKYNPYCQWGYISFSWQIRSDMQQMTMSLLSLIESYSRSYQSLGGLFPGWETFAYRLSQGIDICTLSDF